MNTNAIYGKRNPFMKPLIYRRDGTWYCEGRGFYGFGYNASKAYENWRAEMDAYVSAVNKWLRGFRP
jgi:hypothetical protein